MINQTDWDKELFRKKVFNLLETKALKKTRSTAKFGKPRIIMRKAKVLQYVRGWRSGMGISYTSSMKE